MEIKKDYKQTEVGVIPEDWYVSPLHLISSMHGRIGWQGLKQSEFTMDHDDPFLITGMNFKDGEIRWDEVYHVPFNRYEKAKNIQLKNDDVLLTKDGTIGKVLYINKIPFPNKASLNSHLLVFRPIRGQYIPKYLYYQLDSETFKKHVDQEKSGSTFFGITQEAVGKYKIPLPPTKAEQTAIANALSDADALISNLEKLISKKRHIKQGAMQELLTGKKRLPGFSGEWELKRLGEIIVAIGDGGTPSTNNSENFGGAIHWAVIKDIKDEITTTIDTLTERGLRSCAAKLWPPGTLILSTGATIGEIGIARVPLATKQGICGIVVDETQSNPIFLKYWFAYNTSLLLSKAQGSSIKEVRAPTLIKFDIQLPKYPEQTAIAAFLLDMDTEISMLERKLTKYRLIKQGVMQELLTGKKRLI